MRDRVVPAIPLGLTRGQESSFPERVTTLLAAAFQRRTHWPDPRRTTRVTDCYPDGSPGTRRTLPRKAAFHDCRAAPGRVLLCYTASARRTRLSAPILPHRHSATAASGTRQSTTGLRVPWSCQSTRL